MTFNLFMELNATDEQLDFPIVYGIAKEGIAKLSLDEEGNSIEPLLDTILKQVEPFKGNENDPLQLQISNLDYDDYIGRLGIGRINKGKIKSGETVTLIKNDGSEEAFRVSKLFVNEGIKRVEKDVAYLSPLFLP